MKIDRNGLVALLLAGTLALVGCGGSSDSGPKASTDEKADAPQEQPVESPEPEQEPEPEPEPVAPDTKYPVTIDGVRLGTDYSGNDVVIVTFTWTNNSDETTSFALSVMPKVFQGGIECENAFMVDDADSDKYMTDVRPGTTITVEMAYELQDHSEIEVEVTELFSFSNDPIAYQKFSLE